MSYQTNSVDKNGLARTPDGKLYVTLGSGSTIDSPTFTGTVSGGDRVIAVSYAPVSCPADTSEDTLATITIPANQLGANGAIRLRAHWTMTGSTNNKICRFRFSGGAGTVYAAPTFSLLATTNAEMTLVLSNRNATNSQYGYSVAFQNGGANPSPGVATSAVDTTAQATLVITGQKASAGETLTLEGYICEVLR